MPRTRFLLSTLSGTLFRFLLPPALITLVVIYFYPAIQGCAFPVASSAVASCAADSNGNTISAPSQSAPFRLLALGDPQLEGDTSLPDPDAPAFPSLNKLWQHDLDWSRVLNAGTAVVLKDVPKLFQGYRKRLDLFGNDYYLAHIYRHMRWWTQPTHTVVLGDLLGSQWIDDAEFERRAQRFWSRVFAGGIKVPDEIMQEEGRLEVLGSDPTWKDRVMVVPGNHDVGYSGDITSERIERFERVFGKVNWDITFTLPKTNTTFPPSLHLILLNSMNLDSPAYSSDLQELTKDFLDRQLETPPISSDHATILLTHIPLHKKAGICVDAPYTSYFPAHWGGGIKEQNHLSPNTSNHLIDHLLSTVNERKTLNKYSGGVCFDRSTLNHDRPRAVILNGHDHKGCDTYHYLLRDRDNRADSWEPVQYSSTVEKMIWGSKLLPASQPGLREVTVRSMMGEFGGRAGLLSAWWEPAEPGSGPRHCDGEDAMEGEELRGEWQFEYASCGLGVQHLWWGIHGLALGEVILGTVWLLASLVDAMREDKETMKRPKEKTG